MNRRASLVVRCWVGIVVAAMGAACCGGPAARAQGFGPAEVTKGARLDRPVTQQMQIGMTISAATGPCIGLLGTAPVPIDWPEQKVLVVDEEVSPYVQDLQYRMVNGTVKQMVVSVPQIPAGEEARALLTVEVTRYTLLPPEKPLEFLLPDDRKLPRDVRPYLGPSPLIESTSPKLKTLAKDLLKDKRELPAWQQVETLYDWVRDNVEYQEGPLKGALAALRDKNGDCEELSSLFIALCRASGVPARIVWVPQHCYPEFYLVDAEGQGYWFPCQAAGNREFGGISETRPIMQKGDNFAVPEKPRDRMRYVSEFLTGKGGKPKVKFFHDLVAAGGP